jgi:hypothetical protein
MQYYINPPPMNPISRIIASIVAVLMLAGAFFFGLVVVVVLVALFSLFGLVFWLRLKWLQRKSGDVSVIRPGPVCNDEAIDAEYTVVSKRRN